MDIERPNSWFEPNEEPRTKEYEVVLSISKVVEAVDQEEALEIAKSVFIAIGTLTIKKFIDNKKAPIAVGA